MYLYHAVKSSIINIVRALLTSSPGRLAWPPPEAMRTRRTRKNQIRHPQFGDVAVNLTELEDDPDAQVATTIALMRQYAIDDAHHPAIRAWLWALESGSELATVAQIWRSIRECCTFQLDPTTSAPLSWHPDPIVEVLIRPRHMVQWRRGDCDDFSMLAAALLLTAGIRCAYCTIAADPSAPHLFSHVYVIAYPGGKEVAVDASHGPHCGWQARGTRKQVWPI